MTTPKLTLNLNEENELAFRVSIEGTSSDINSTKPKYRFVISEGGSEHGTLYPAVQDEDGSVVVNISGNESFLEETDYRGKLEVILGNHYFVPTEVEIEFTKPLKVEAAVISKSGKSLREEKQILDSGEEEMKVSSAGVSLRRNKKEKMASAQQVKEKTKPAKKKWESLSVSEKKLVVEAHKKKKIEALKKKAQAEAKAKKIKEDALKKQLKNLMTTSLKEEKDSE